MSGVEDSVRLRDCYVTLQVDRTAAIDDVKAAYRRLARLHHPDLNPDNPAAEERFRMVNDAYETVANHLAMIALRDGRSTEQAAPKQPSGDRSDWEKNEAYSSFVDVLLGNRKSTVQN